MLQAGNERLRAVGLVLAGLLGFLPATRAADPPEGPPQAAPAAREFIRVQTLPDQVTLAELDNGLTVIVQENHVAPVATVRCYVNQTGSAYEAEWLGAGISHLVEHIVSGGSTSQRTEAQIERMIDTFGGATNAFTSTHLTGYFIDCPARNAGEAIELVSEAMQDCIFAVEEFEREMRVVRQELADGLVDRRRVQWNLLHQLMYRVHPIRHPITGYRDVLDRITREAVIDFYRQRYVPNNMVFVVVGSVETSEVLAQLAELWSETVRGHEPQVPLPPEPTQLSPRRAVREMDGAGYDQVLAWPTVELAHPDLYALDVAAYVLAEGESSRLARRLKYDQPLALSVGSASYTPDFASGFFAIFSSTSPETWQETGEVIVREVYRLREELVSDEELAKAKKQKAADLVFGSQTVQQAADRLGRNFLATGDPLFDQQYVQAIQKVTAAEVRDVAQRYFVSERLNRVILAPPGGAPEVEEERRVGDEGQVRWVRLDNGLRVLVKSHTHLPLVNMQAFTLGASLVDTPETAGRAALVGAMLDKGTESLSGQQIAEYFDSIGGQLTTRAGRNTVYGSATVLRDDFERAFEVFADCLLRPTFPDDQFARLQTRTLAAIDRRADNAQAEVFELFYDSLPVDSPYHLLQEGKRETVERLGPDDLRRYHQQYFVPENMVVTVFGDVQLEQAVELVRQHFGDWSAAEDFQPIEWERPHQIGESIVRHKQTSKDTGMLIVAFPGTSIRDAENHAALTVLDAIMSGYRYPGGWLHNELRGAGLVYFVHAFQITGPAPGYFAILAQTQPDQIAEVLSRVDSQIERAISGQIEEDEFQTAKQRILALHAQENTTIQEQGLQAALDELYGLGYDYDQTFEERINAVSLEDVRRVARDTFGHRIVVTTSPDADPLQTYLSASED